MTSTYRLVWVMAPVGFSVRRTRNRRSLAHDSLDQVGNPTFQIVAAMKEQMLCDAARRSSSFVCRGRAAITSYSLPLMFGTEQTSAVGVYLCQLFGEVTVRIVCRSHWQWAFAASLVMTILSASMVARADDDDEGEGKHHRHRHDTPYYVVVPPGPVRYYAPPPVVYAPPPVIVYPAAPVYDAPYIAPAYPSLNINIPLR
jgi:hypothetical protein